MSTRSARIRALSGVPTPTAISLTPAESNLGFASFRTEASSQLKNVNKGKELWSCSDQREQ